MISTGGGVAWASLEHEAPELAAAVWARFEAHLHHVLATVRSDGSPRVSGTEVVRYGPDLMVGSMLGAVKAADLLADGRFALHANPGGGAMEDGDAKLAGVATEVEDPEVVAGFLPARDSPPGPFHLFRLEITQAVMTTIHPDGDRLVIESWRPGQAVRRIERA